jgi:DNA-binding Lrp family transcriptional regulator
MKPYKVNEKGEQILRILSENSKTTIADIAKQIAIPEKDVIKYIREFEEEKVILGYKANINWQRVRQDDVKAVIEVKVTPERKVGFDAVAESIYRFPEVSTVYLISGRYDLLVHVDGLTLREVAQFVSEKLATIKNVQSTSTHFLLKKYKEDGVIFVEQAGSKRLPITL